MTVKECYDMMGGGYEDVIKRLLDDKRVVKFAVKFLWIELLYEKNDILSLCFGFLRYGFFSCGPIDLAAHLVISVILVYF